MAADGVDSSIHQYYWITGYYQDSLLVFFFFKLKICKIIILGFKDYLCIYLHRTHNHVKVVSCSCMSCIGFVL